MKRRDFVKSVVAAAGIALVAPTIGLASVPLPKKISKLAEAITVANKNNINLQWWVTPGAGSVTKLERAIDETNLVYRSFRVNLMDTSDFKITTPNKTIKTNIFDNVDVVIIEGFNMALPSVANEILDQLTSNKIFIFVSNIGEDSKVLFIHLDAVAALLDYRL